MRFDDLFLTEGIWGTIVVEGIDNELSLWRARSIDVGIICGLFFG